MARGTTRRPLRARQGEQGSALMMVPACTLVLLCLLGTAVDGAIVRSAQRRLQSLCDAVADDAAGVLDGRALQVDGAVRLDGPRAARLATTLLRARRLEIDPPVGAEVRTSSAAGTVDLVLRTRVDHLVLPSLPGGLGGTSVGARCRGRLRP